MTQEIETRLIETNHGQINGVPGNPRRVSVRGITHMCDSIREDPDFLHIRPIAVFRHKGKYVCLGGNTRLKAARRLNLEKVPCVVIPDDTGTEKLRRFVIKDNGHYGEWDAAALLGEWDCEKLDEWGAEVQFEKERKVHAPGWKSNTKDTRQHLTTLGLMPAIHKNGNHWYLSLYETTKTGYPLDEVKAERFVERFAEDACTMIKGMLGGSIDDVAVMTTPRRRHKDFHFATAVCKSIAEKMRWQVVEDAFTAKDCQKLNPVFTFNPADIAQKNIVLFDDIATTGATLQECHKRLPKGKNVITVIGVYNGKVIDYEQ